MALSQNGYGLSIYIYIRRPLFRGATRLRGICFQLHINCFLLSILQLSVFPVHQSETASLQSAVSKLKTGIFDFGVFLGPGTIPLPSPGCVLSAWAPPGYPQKIIEFQTYSQDLHKSGKASPRYPKSYQKDIQKSIGYRRVH